MNRFFAAKVTITIMLITVHCWNVSWLLASNSKDDASMRLRSALRDAITQKSGDVRVDQIRKVLGGFLLIEDQTTRTEAFEYLYNHQRWLDLRPWADVLAEFDKLQDSDYGQIMLSRAALLSGPREERLAAYKSAIESGSFACSRSYRLLAFDALRFAALDGFEELLPTIRDKYDSFPPSTKRNLPLEWVTAHMELRHGAADRDDAGRLAVMRISQMNDHVFLRRMEEDPGFRKAVMDSTKFVCAVDPYRGGYSKDCDYLTDVLMRQYNLANGDRVKLQDRSGDWFQSMEHACEPAWPAWKEINATRL